MFPATYALPAAVLLVAGGALSCFMGYRLFRLVLGIYGFVLGALLATSVLPPAETTMITVVVALAGGVGGALVLVFAYFVGVAFAGAALAALLVHIAWSQFGTRDPHPLAVIVACVAGALASLVFQRYVIVLGTAFGGAWTFVVGVLTFMGQRKAAAAATAGDVWLAYPLNLAPGQRWVEVAWLVLGGIGALVQLAASSGPRTRSRAKRVRRAA
jgi:hypothetical protein